MWNWRDLKRIFMRKAMRDIADLGAVMWPVLYPGDMMPPDNAHITVVIFNDINNPDLGYTRDDVMDAVANTLHDVFLWVEVEGLEWFGENADIPVLRISHGYLEAYRNSLLLELEARGIPVDMTFPDYKPHVTITDEAALDRLWPSHLMTGPVEVWWGDQHYKMPERLVRTKVAP